MMRRRALLAASQTGGGGFYADFHFDYCEEVFFTYNCYRADDELGVACYKEVVRLLEKYGTQESSFFSYLDNPINYGFEVYIEGTIVSRIFREYGTYSLITDGEYYSTVILSDGSLTYER